MYLHVKLVDVAPDGGSHILLYGQGVVERPETGRPLRSTSATPATG